MARLRRHGAVDRPGLESVQIQTSKTKEMIMITLETAGLVTPLGDLTMFARDGALCALGFADRRDGLVAALERRFGTFATRASRDPAGAVTALAAYAAGDLATLETLEVDPGGTPFQQRVWHALREIPAGHTMSYGALARALGEPRALRAVGAANGRNPIAIVIPCHRVIASDGTLHGYGGGLDRKRMLLDHERLHARVPLMA
jgi:methylated-DNA-[protein]-cysteine S-methyltransferase